MNIYIDSSPLHSGHKHRGVGEYTRNLITALKNYFPQHDYSSPDPKLMHYPYFDLFFPTLPLIKKNPTIVTIHDVIPLKYPHLFPLGPRGKFNLLQQKLALRSVKSIITVSKASKKNIIQYLKIPSKKIQVIHSAVDRIFSLKPKTKFDRVKLPSKFLLYVGDINPNKNLPNLIQAVKQTKTKLAIVSRALANKNIPESKQIHKLVNSQITIITDVDQSELNQLYHQATIYVQPSLDEGFGFPLLEAMTAGCPTISTRAGSLSEVGGSAPLYAKSPSTINIAKAIRKLWNNPKLQNELKKKSLTQAKKFSWQKTALNTLKVYEKILN
jgi:glycosyltransferase involved in cell wall biosynthesis